MNSRKRTYVAAALAMGMASHSMAAMELAPPTNFKWAGFGQAWAEMGENPKKVYNQVGLLLKRFRIKMTAEPYDGLSAVFVPELAGGVTVLDAYLSADLSKYLIDFSPAITLTAGQFKTPFGQNRMYIPPQLLIQDYSGIYTAVMEDKSFWDQGFMASYKIDTLKVDVAIAEGLGPNQATPGGNAYGQKFGQDVYVRAEYGMLGGMVMLGGSLMNGEHFTTPGTVAFPAKAKTVTGAHVKLKGPGKSYDLEAELVNRDVDRGGFTVQPSYWITDGLQVVAAYDRFENYTGGAKLGTTRFIGGLNWFPSGPLRISFLAIGEATGPSQVPQNSKSVIQTQIVF